MAGEKASQNGTGMREQVDENRPRLATIQKQRVAVPLLVGSKWDQKHCWVKELLFV